MNKKLTLGSLFDGSGAFGLAGMMCGIEPVWASEIEPYPIRVTTKRMPTVVLCGALVGLGWWIWAVVERVSKPRDRLMRRRSKASSRWEHLRERSVLYR